MPPNTYLVALLRMLELLIRPFHTWKLLDPVAIRLQAWKFGVLRTAEIEEIEPCEANCESPSPSSF